jgi:hypothetical protein
VTVLLDVSGSVVDDVIVAVLLMVGAGSSGRTLTTIRKSAVSPL